VVEEDEIPLDKEDKELELIQEEEDLHTELLLVEDIHREQDGLEVPAVHNYRHRNLPVVHLEAVVEVDHREVPDPDIDQTEPLEAEVQLPEDTDQEEPGMVEAAVLGTVQLGEEWRSLEERVTRLQEMEKGCC